MRNTNRHKNMRGKKNPKQRIANERRVKLAYIATDYSSDNRDRAKDARKDRKRQMDMPYSRLTPHKPGSFMHGKQGNGKTPVNSKRGNHGHTSHAARNIMWPKPTLRGY